MVIATLYFFSLFIAFGSFELNSSYALAFAVYISSWPVLSYLKKDYKIGRAVSYYNTFKKAFASTFIFVSLISLMWLFIAGESINRHFMMALILLLFVWLTIYRVFVHIILDRYRTFGGNIRNAVIIGYDRLGFNLYNVLGKKPQYGIRCQGFYSFSEKDDPKDGYPLLGDLDNFLSKNLDDIDSIYISEKISRLNLNLLIKKADEGLVKVKLLPEFKTDIVKSFSLRRFDLVPVVDVNNLPLDNRWNLMTKRVFDFGFSLLVVLCVLSWMYPLFGLIIKLESRGPVLFKQLRHGKGNVPFRCYKFRTMVMNQGADTLWASKNDPRVTRFGTFLRRTSLDEFPQFINVLIGDMSIVGPRPHPISLNQSFENKVEKFAKRHASKPGVTGLAQSMGYRGEISDYYQMSSRVRLDRFYLQNWSFWLDIKIIFLTIYSLIRGQDLAY